MKSLTLIPIEPPANEAEKAALLAELAGGDQSARLKALGRLGVHVRQNPQDQLTLAAIRTAAGNDSSDAIRKRATGILIDFADPDCFDAVIQRLTSDADVGVRTYAANCVAAVADKQYSIFLYGARGLDNGETVKGRIEAALNAFALVRQSATDPDFIEAIDEGARRLREAAPK